MSAHSIPPRIRRRAPWWLVAGLAAATAVLFLCDPALARFYPPCPLHAVTGLDCPGCGATRAAHALLHGRVAEAVRLNALFVFGLPLAAAWWVLRRNQGTSAVGTIRLTGRTLLVSILVVCTAFMVLRNLPRRERADHSFMQRAGSVVVHGAERGRIARCHAIAGKTRGHEGFASSSSTTGVLS